MIDKYQGAGMKKIYLSGPMTGKPGLNHPLFNAQAARLRALGYEVINPAEVILTPGSSWQECMRNAIHLLCKCDTIALLPGWADSKGAVLECYIARETNISVWPVQSIT